MMSSRGRGEGHVGGRRRGGAPEWGTSSHPRRIPTGGEGGCAADGPPSSANPAMATGGMAPPATGALVVLALFEEARLGVELIGRALSDWDKLMLRDLLPDPTADQYWQDVARVRTLTPIRFPSFLLVPSLYS
ncbi:hypothetical protein U1Q18_027335 [Sarracenia purpurea var. burkii]